MKHFRHRHGPPADLALFDLHPPPEGDAVLDGRRRRAWIRVAPGGVRVYLLADFDRVVAGSPLAEAAGMRGRGLKQLESHRLDWEIVIPLNNYGVVAFGDDFAVPDRSQ